MICPSCNKSPLRPTKINENLPALSCAKCNGYLLSMLSYRVWVEGSPEIPDSDVDIEELNDTSRAIICPKCQKMMSKYRISGEASNKLDSCGSCGELWIDSGEWDLLHSLGLVDKLSSILSQPWQNKIKHQENELSYESRYKNLLGNENYLKVKAFRDWLNDHKNKLEIKNYIARVNR